MPAEVGFEVVDTEGRVSWSEVTGEHLCQVDHEHRQIGGIVNRELLDIHEIFQTPELFSVTEIELDLETEAIIVK